MKYWIIGAILVVALLVGIFVVNGVIAKDTSVSAESVSSVQFSCTQGTCDGSCSGTCNSGQACGCGNCAAKTGGSCGCGK